MVISCRNSKPSNSSSNGVFSIDPSKLILSWSFQLILIGLWNEVEEDSLTFSLSLSLSLLLSFPMSISSKK